MEALHIEPFDDARLDDASRLLAERHARDRVHEPALPARFAEPDGARAVVVAAWREPHARGVAAVRDGRLVGFLLAAPEFSPIWGRSAWVRLGGHAVASTESADLYRDLYAALAPHWLALGCFTHYAMIPASDRAALDAWFALSFGQQQAFALREVPTTKLLRPPLDDAIELRRAGPDDLDIVMDVAELVAAHQARSPVYGVTLPEHRAEWRAEYAQLLADPAVYLWIAVRAGVALGFAMFTPQEAGDQALYVPERCCDLLLAGTREEQRGQGVGRALVAQGLAAARDAGYAYCAVDWRTTNLLASRFWPRQGFRPVAYRLTRMIDKRIVWANNY